MTATPLRGKEFRYVGYDVEPDRNRLVCRYELDGRDFREELTFPAGGPWDDAAVGEAARLVFLLAGVSYYKTAAPPVIELGDLALTDRERAFLHEYYLDGLGEFAYRGGLDLSDLEFRAPRLERAAPVAYSAAAGRPLVPFGGGVDSIVSVELLRPLVNDPALFVVNRPGDRFAAIEEPAGVTGWPIVRAERQLDPAVLRSRELGFLNGHVPVTGIISAIAVLAATLQGRDAVIMSNEWSASSATLQVAGRAVNHQWSKGEAFEAGLRSVLAGAISPAPEYFSLLRPFTELWIARRFAELPQYAASFRSCNRAFQLDPDARLDHWCGVCDKCAFIDLILAPFVESSVLRGIFAHPTPFEVPESFANPEPLANSDLLGTFRRLLALTPDSKPWECVGDESESRVAARLAAAREDRRDNAILRRLVDEASAHADPSPADLLAPIGSHFVPDRYAPDALLG